MQRENNPSDVTRAVTTAKANVCLADNSCVAQVRDEQSEESIRREREKRVVVLMMWKKRPKNKV